MNAHEGFSSVLALIGEPARAKMLWYLLEGRAYTATELAVEADVSPQSASMHLKKLRDANLVTVEKQGRHRYFRLMGSDVAYALEALAYLVPTEPTNQMELGKALQEGIRYARTCYDHLAGEVGVKITGALLQNGYLSESATKYHVTGNGIRWFTTLDIDVEALRKSRRPLARKCLDWSARRHHLAGALGSALLHTMLALDWIRRKQFTREVLITSEGKTQLYDRLQIKI